MRSGRRVGRGGWSAEECRADYLKRVARLHGPEQEAEEIKALLEDA